MPKPSSSPPSKSTRKSTRRAAPTQPSSPPTQTSTSLTPPSERTRAKPHYELDQLIDIDFRDGEVQFLVRWKDDDGVMIESWNCQRHHTFKDKGNRGTLRTLVENLLRVNPRRSFHKQVCAYLARSEAKDYEAIRDHIVAEKRRAGERTVYASEEENDDEDEEEEDDEEGDQKKPTGRALIEKKFKKEKTEVEKRLTRMRSSSAGNRRYNDMIYDRPSRGPARRTSHQDRRPNRRLPATASPDGRSAKSVTKTHSKNEVAKAASSSKTQSKKVPVVKSAAAVPTPSKKALDSKTTAHMKTLTKAQTAASKTPVKKLQTTVIKAASKKSDDNKKKQFKGGKGGQSGKSAAKPKK